MGTSSSKEEKPTLLSKAQAKNEKISARLPSSSLHEDEATTVKTDESSSMNKSSDRMVDATEPVNGVGNGKRNGKRNQKQRTSYPQPAGGIIKDDQVQVNLAMADLMAYLQVVANNSQNLPMTRRDDPEIRKSVTTLTAEEYAKKSAAFVPADVRVIGGSFTKYGRVWDLPTSEEYNASDGAQEPGLSFGGAICNSMLKVLYDTATEAVDSGEMKIDPESLFDDDDDESLMKASVLGRNRTFESLVLGDISTPSTITWANLLRKMSAEMRDIEYAQAPTITSTRKIDLNKPFSLIPEDFDPKKGKKRSLLIGCNYGSTHGAELAASHDDIRSMKDYIVNVHGFSESEDLMTVLLDDDQHKHPTHKNITDALKTLSEQSQPGDAIFVQFSGHGGRVLDAPIDDEAESYDEAIAPCDYTVSGLIRDTLIFKTLFAPMRYGVTVTVMIDSCDTGVMVELPYAWSTKKDRPGSTAKMTMNDDFSFVRFLKVVKTLYEASVFTQLGNVVGSALDGPVSRSLEEGVTHEEEDGNASILSEDPPLAAAPAKQSLILSALASCTSPTNQTQVDMSGARMKQAKNSGGRRQDDNATSATDKSASQSLFDSVLNSCVAGGEDDDDDSDEDTYKTDGVGDASTFDSLTDDGYDPRHNRGRRLIRREV